MIDRRSILTAAAWLAAGSALGLRPALAAETSLRLYWWGSPDRSRRTLDVAKLFEQARPGTTAAGESVGGDYWTKLATMLVGRNLPDVIQFEPTALPDFFRRGAMLPLDDILGKSIRTDRLAPGTFDLTRVDGKVAGVPLGVNSFAIIYDTEVFERTGLPVPSHSMTWAAFADLCVELTKAVDRNKVWGAPNASRYNYIYDMWLRQRGKSLFTEAGDIGFTVDDAKEWYDYWETLRKRGGCVGPDIQSLDQSLIDSNPLARGNSVLSFAFSNQLIGYQSVLKQKLGMTTLPVAWPSGPTGMYYRPALIWSIGKTSRNAEAAAAFIDFFVNDRTAGKILGVERGVPVNLDVRDDVKPLISDLERMTVDYIAAIADRVGPYPAPVPKGVNEFDHGVMRPTADQLAFGQLTVAQAEEKLVSEGRRVIRA